MWGRSLLYSCLNASHFTWASTRDKNQFWSMHSARTLPLKASTALAYSLTLSNFPVIRVGYGTKALWAGCIQLGILSACFCIV
jgi:hypothetical protein